MDPETANVSKMIDQIAQDPTLQKKWRAMLALSDSDPVAPKPQDQRGHEDTAPPPFKGKKDSDSQNLSGTPAPKLTSGGDLLSMLHDFSLVRRVPQERNYWVPNAQAMMQTLNLMDKTVIRKFKARREALLMCPPVHVEYYAILWSLQTARCLLFAGYLESDKDQSFLRNFFDRYPPQNLPIAGPLLPFFKAVTTFRHENGTYKRISPGFPADSLSQTTPADGAHIRNNQANLFFPNVPFIVDLIGRMMKNVKLNTSKDFIPWTEEFPFEIDDATDNTKYFKDAKIIGGKKFEKNVDNWHAMQFAAMGTPGIKHKIPMNDAIANNVFNYISDLQNPNAKDTEYQVDGLQDWLRMEDMSWFTEILGPMAEHAELFQGSGTLNDCQVDGPSSGAYVYRYENSVRSDRPRFPFDKKATFELSGNLFTTISSSQPIDERLSALTQINCRLDKDHWFEKVAPKSHGRNGNVWKLGPVYGPSDRITSSLTMENSVSKLLNEKKTG
jgi:hypothetical protein